MKVVNIMHKHKINHSAGYKLGDHRKDGVKVFPINKEIAVGKVFHFGNGITFKSVKLVKLIHNNLRFCGRW